MLKMPLGAYLTKWTLIWYREITSQSLKSRSQCQPATAWGGGVGSDPLGFSKITSSSLTSYCIFMKLCTPLRASIWRRLVQQKSKPAGNFCYRSNFVTSLHAIFSPINGKCLKIHQKWNFKANAKQKSIIHRKERFTKWLSRILKFCFFDPKNVKNHLKK